MIDFENKDFLKLKQVDYISSIDPLLIPEEEVIGCYKTVRDSIVFTDRRIIAINVQGLTGKRKDFTSLPYSKIQLYSVETAGIIDLDSELHLWFSGIGIIRFEFTAGSNIVEIGRAIAAYLL